MLEQQAPPPLDIIKRSPIAAVLLSYVNSGLGALYNGSIGKAASLFVIEFALSLWLTFIILSRPSLSSLAVWLMVTGVYKISAMAEAGVSASRQKEYLMRPFNRWYIYILAEASFFVTIVLFGIIIGRNVYSSYSIPTGSMRETILAGDFIIEDRTAYGLHVPFSSEYIFINRLPERNDIVIFMTPENVAYIKRCIGLPGDSIEITDKLVHVNGAIMHAPSTAHFSGHTLRKGIGNNHIFPKGTDWNEDNYGPIRVPKAGDTIRISHENLEGWKGFITGDSETGLHSISSTAEKGYYVVKKDYVFVMGDSRNNSLDSRYIGFVPVEKVTGKAKWVYFSKDLNTNKIRTERIGLELQ
jgi:signal peptidase I